MSSCAPGAAEAAATSSDPPHVPEGFKDIANQEYGYWPAVRFVARRRKATFWVYRCVCGLEREMSSTYVLGGTTRSCGCRKGELIAKAKRRERVLLSEQKCNKCLVVRPARDFRSRPEKPGGLDYTCKYCICLSLRERRRIDSMVSERERERCRKWKLTERARDFALRRNYGISVSEYRALAERQGGVCAICGAQPEHEFQLCVDHEHVPGVAQNKCPIRGLLCRTCNSGIGHLGDTEVGVAKALEYLKAFNARHAELNTNAEVQSDDRPVPGRQSDCA